MERRAITIRGLVQGVGMRPFVHGLARCCALTGSVRNRLDGIRIEVEGEPPALERFLRELVGQPPPLARIDEVTWEALPVQGEREFQIEPSEIAGTGSIFIAPDAATCADCLAELFDPVDRRYRYPFLNCTNCGPRLTIVTGAPYDRQRTTMAGFTMCAACRAEYENPADRRFHAQPTCCPACGPSLRLLDGNGEPIDTADPLVAFADMLLAGRIGAIKGLGGFHLACDTRSATAVETLRRGKNRDDKPFAVLVADIERAESLCLIGAAELELLRSPGAPIVLLPRRPEANVAEAVAPGNPHLGLMLPYTPLHHLLVHALGRIPLVLTSGNRSDEPIAYENADALARLNGLADCFLVHDRPIHVRCDDSVTRWVGGAEMPIRRSRGYAPQTISMPVDCREPTLALGGQLKCTFAFGRNRRAFLSHHLGDLDHPDAYSAFEKDIALYEDLFAFRPRLLVHDLHPDYVSSRYAQERGLALLAVQHHHAHMASCMAENGRVRPVLGVVFDGTGFGLDGTVWGGEFLVGDLGGFIRAAHLRRVGMPGGEQAIREPWRMAVSQARDAGVPPGLLQNRIPAESFRIVEGMVARNLRCPITSSAGRLFDAVASLIGLRDRVRYEGQAAIELEWAAMTIRSEGSYPFEIEEPRPGEEFPLVVDTRPLVRAVVRDLFKGTEPSRIARRFHSTLVAVIVAVCKRLRSITGLDAVALSGGVFLNGLLFSETITQLEGEGFLVLRHRLVPPGDGGLSLGQLAIAGQKQGPCSLRPETDS